MPQTFYEVVWIFIIYAFLGWCSEVAFAAVDRGIFVNRGFLNGPYCPIYGCGVLAVVVVLTPLKDNLLILYIGSFFLTSVIEFITGFVLEKVFHNKWWDYSDKPLNIMGYVCLKFSIIWGFACTFIMLILHPIIYGLIQVIPFILGIILLVIMMTAFAVDFVVTVLSIIKFNKRLKLMDEIASKLKVVSNEIGENVYEGVMEALEKKESFSGSVDNLKTNVEYHKDIFTDSVKDTMNETKDKFMGAASGMKDKLTDAMMETKDKLTETAQKAKLIKEKEELTSEYNKLCEKKNPVFTRLMKAFPDMKSDNHNELLQKLKTGNIKKLGKPYEEKN